MKKVKLNSPKGTKKEDMMFAVETTGIVNREKMSYEDVVKKITLIDEDIENKKAQKVELTAIKSEMDKLIK